MALHRLPIPGTIKRRINVANWPVSTQYSWLFLYLVSLHFNAAVELLAAVSFSRNRNVLDVSRGLRGRPESGPFIQIKAHRCRFSHFLLSSSRVCSITYADHRHSHLNRIQPLFAVIDAKSADAKDIQRAAKFSCIAFKTQLPLEADPDEEPIGSEPDLALMDQRGHIYVFDIENDTYIHLFLCFQEFLFCIRFDLVARTGIAGTAMAFGTIRRWELVVALSDRALHCYNIGFYTWIIYLILKLCRNPKTCM